MKTLLLSFKPEVFEKIKSGTKIYEHRRVFPDEEIEAYIYISRPVQAIAGIIHLGNKMSLLEWKDKYSYDKYAVERIDNYLEKYKVVMEIHDFQDTNHISLSELKEIFPDFLIPQMYYYLDDLPLLAYLKKNIRPVGTCIEHRFDEITSEMICIH